MPEKTKDYYKIMDEATAFESQFRDPENPSVLQKNLRPEDILAKLGFRRVRFEDLDPHTQESIRRSKRKTFYACPVDRSGNPRNDVIIMQNTDGSVIYFCKDAYGEYAISRLAKGKMGYTLSELNNDLNIAEIIENISFMDIKNPQNPELFPRYDGADIRIPFPEPMPVEETRARLSAI